MGLTRKMMSMGTMGAVDFRSDKERTAAYTKGMRKQARKQTKIMKQQTQAHAQAPAPAQGWQPNPLQGWSPPAAAIPAAAVVPPPPAPTGQPAPPPPSPPAAWYPDQSQPGIQRYWDGSAWTDHTAPL